MLKRHSQVMLTLLGVGDLLTMTAAWGAGYAIRVLGGRWGWSRMPTPGFDSYLPAMVLCLALTVILFSRFGLYRVMRTRSLFSEVSAIVRAIFITWGLTYVAANFMQRTQMSRLMMGGVLASWLCLAIGGRLAARAALRGLRRRGWNLRHAAIIGAGRLAQTLHHTLERNAWTGIKTRYFIGDGEKTESLLGCEVRGPLADVETILSRHPVDIIFVALSGRQYERREEVISALAAVGGDVRVLPDLLAYHFLGHEVSQLDNLPIIGLTSTPQDGWNAMAKRAMDVVFSLAGIILASPLMLLIAAAVKLTSPGPVFFRQERASLGGQPFEILKFRTMRPDAEAATGAVWAQRNDPRVTTIGRLLRKTSLDELPQLFNILAGTMSLVGPRPERPELIERFRKQVPRYMLRSHVKAGLTGWAQIHGLRGRTSLRKRVQYDLHYIVNWSIGLDLRIIALTPFRGLIHPNAY